MDGANEVLAVGWKSRDQLTVMRKGCDDAPRPAPWGGDELNGTDTSDGDNSLV